MFDNADRVAGIAVIVSAFLIFLATLNVDINPNQSALSARFFPFVLAISLLFLGVMLWVSAANTSNLSEALAPFLNPRVISITALILIYFIGFRFIDFRVGAWLFTLISMWLLGSRGYKELLLVPIITSALIYTIFRHGFTVLLPTWI